MLGPPQTPYEGGVYQFLIDIPQNYPFKCPECVFRTKIFHNKYNEENSKFCDIDFTQTWSPTKKMCDLLLFYKKAMNIYDYPCNENCNAKKMMYNNFNEFLKKSKFFTKNYASFEGIELKPDFNLIEKSADELNIEPPKEKDYMPKIEKIYDKNIKKKDIEIIVTEMLKDKEIKLNMKTTDFIIDIAIKIREYVIKEEASNCIAGFLNLLPKIIIKSKEQLELNKEIGSYDIKNLDKIYFYFNIPTCDNFIN